MATLGTIRKQLIPIVPILEPTYTACASAAASCTSSARLSLRFEYTPKKLRTSYITVKLSREYQRSWDDKSNSSAQEQESSKFSPPMDVLDVKARIGDSDGRDHLEMRAGYTYQHSDGVTNDAYHSAYLSGDYFFGAPIEAGSDGLSRSFDVFTRLSQNFYSAAGRPDEMRLQIVPTYTVPINRDGTTRVYASYTREARIIMGNTLPVSSNRFDTAVVRDMTPSIQGYARLSIFGSKGLPGLTKVIVGIEIKL